MHNPSTKYRNQLKRKLHCTPTSKRLLLKKIDTMLHTYLEENPSATAAEMETAFGSSDEMAQILMNEVTSYEQEQYRRRNAAVRMIAAIALAAFVLFTIYIYFIKEIGITVKDNVVEIPTGWTDNYDESEENE